MKVALYLNQHSGSSPGGSLAFGGALVKALGDLHDGNEHYLVLTNRDHVPFLKPLIGENQTLVELPYTAAGAGRHIIEALAFKWHALQRRAERFRLFSKGGNQFCRVPDPDSLKGAVSVSNGFIESLGASVVHFTFQEFIVTSLPSVFNPHDLQHLHFPQFFRPNSLVRRELLYRFACQSASRIVVASQLVADDLRDRYCIAANRISVIPWGAATAALPPPTANQVEAVRNKYELPARFAFYPAVAWHHKNHANLLQAIAALAKQKISVPIVLTGGNTPLVNDLRGLAQKLGIKDLTFFLGSIPSSDIRAVYRSASIVVVPTLFEAVSGPMAEAWLEGVPVICSDIRELRSQGGDAVLYFDRYNPESIAGTIAKVWNDPTSAKALVERGQAQIAKLAWDQTAKAYRQVYRVVAEESSILAMQLPKMLVL